MAESPVTFSGYLRLRTYATGGYFSRPGTDVHHKGGERFAVTRFRVSLVFKPNDNVEVRWRFHAPHGTRWGATNELPFRTMYAFGILKTSFGNFSVGRISTDIDSAGLQTLGYIPTWGMGSQGYIFDHDTERDGIMYRYDWDNGFGIKVFYSKMNSFDANANIANNIYPKDADYDRYSVEPYYKWENGGASLALQYDRNVYSTNTDLNTHPAKNHYFSINPAFMHKWNLGGDTSLAIHAEAKYSTGKYKLTGDPNAETHKQDGFGAYMDLALGYGSGTATLAGWYFDGDGERQRAANSTDFASTRHHNLVQPGQGFYPFVVFYRNHTPPSWTMTASQFGGLEQPNHWAFALMGNHSITKNITLNYGIADFRKSRGAQLVDGTQISKHLGTEFDLGIVIKFFETVQFSSKLGIFAAGPYYKERYLNDSYDGTIWAWGNELIFNF
ncbi:MAG: hypothetical protein LBF40_04985 [Deltaproteobacteria bacterium]|nr:hypothetical protein [Deltaproteobacteria bacterium]